MTLSCGIRLSADDQRRCAAMRFLGIDLAWGEGSSAKPANRSGVVALDEHGQVLNAGWTIGLVDTAA